MAEDPLRRRLGPLTAVFENGWYVDPLIAKAVNGPGRAAAATLAGPVDQGTIDGAVNGTAAAVALLGRGLRRLQTGFVRNYALALFTGGTLALFFLLFRASL
jgi:NADH-quinone oxidoreductase subunit L